MRLSGLVSDQEKSLASLYNELGKAYYAEHAESYEDSFAPMITAIKDCKAKIDDLSEQIKKLKGITRCPQCGNDVPYGAPFCSACGAKQQNDPAQAQAEEEQAARFCAKCGAQIAPGHAFCTACGAKVE